MSARGGDSGERARVEPGFVGRVTRIGAHIRAEMRGVSWHPEAACPALDSLRLGLKYLIFDLEATRRENTELKKKLDQNPPR